ncbi:hypothetical protein COW36_23005 [bacterium (Candidatus Blackallbacteria) CG17_big_fil_post_rev_8_21_14_2_50_48_46]|uniref:Uncharacterized protein n=1 Tax=bacterium (Candidatus Blackallbacteria) CG17_big_fil_post_rev_8_21_14_2_50_48_46 TaxID=2014261 RepID=A0A2M7FXU9_9BACT|nr:MAG: hypothetical protein COW64_16075 [bacterium (Candidatus Blackallbacteria) CG18_big_fil_WC_8_21_14_2_50_49_26]PIW14120.1 MAG: hypothetical protein COW36_23005 [bacterium (Candidatus Blackallbacteria) CG17_big_fil_post_rev_8_21_14_2_50_48_46]PIW45850.1 MAG: hypothetical protein COW20_18670 [bacterium (Candidatus Blackallbacteria) CG13_big_fil_rev_8_21_14_2_50_49_14]
MNISPQYPAYGAPVPTYGNPNGPYVPSGQVPYGSPGYANDVYRPTGPYQTGYVQGASAAYGASSSISSAASGIGNIFTSLTSIIAKILNTIVSLVVKVIKGILGFFGIGKDKQKQQQPQQGQPPMPGGAQPGMMPPGGSMPQAPPGTDINQARQVVAGDLQQVQDPGTAFRHIDLHAKKALDNRRQAEEEARHAESLAQEASVLAQRIEQSQGRMPPQQLNQTLSELESKKSQALESLKRAEEYTKATYDEALYANLAMDELLPRFPQVPALAQDANRTVQDAWKAWTTGVEESQYLFFTKKLPAAPEVFTRSVGTVTAYLNQVDQILGRVVIQR